MKSAVGLLTFATLTLVSIEAQVIPAEYTFPTPTSVNGSSATGNCASVSSSTSGTLTCADPTSSVLFDDPRGMPILTGLDGDMWASQLLTIQTTAIFTEITVDLLTPTFTRVERIEVVMFNCPQLGIGVQTIQAIEHNNALIQIASVGITSCTSLVRVCLSTATTIPILILRFRLSPDSDWVHLAEVTFFGNGVICPPDIIITEPTTEPVTTEPTTEITSAGLSTLLVSTTPPFTSTQCEVRPSCSTSVALASVITAIITTLLATVIFVLVLVAVCKCHPKFTPGGAETGTSAGEGEGQEYEQMDMGEGGVAVSDPTYMEVGAAEEKTLELKQNEAYATNMSQRK